MKQSNWKYFVALAALAVVALAACSNGSAKAATPVQLAAQTSNDQSRPTIHVSGHGKVEGTPDVATIDMGVNNTAPSAQAALSHNNERADTLIDALKSHGVAAKDIQTSDLSVAPNFDKDGHVTGYSASNTVTARLRDISKAGAVIDAAASTVGNDIRMNGVSFSIDDTSALVAKARANAVKDAIDQARQLAAAAGVKLGAIHTIDDTGTQLPEPKYYDGAGSASGAQASVPLEAGSQELSVDVVVVYDIAP